MFKHYLTIGLLLAAPAWADQSTPIDERRPLNADGRLTVSNVSGLIQVQAWDRNEMHLSGELGAGVEKLEISGDTGSLRVEVRHPRNAGNVEDSVLKLQVPASVRLELDTVSADIEGSGLRGPIKAQSVSGDVSLTVESPELRVQTVSGDITLRGPSRDTQINSVSGDIRLSGLRERLRLETVSGDVEASGEGLSDLQLKTVSGELDLACSLSGPPRIEMESLSGNIRLRLAEEPDALLSLRSFSGQTDSRYGESTQDSRKRFEAKLGEGRGRIDLHSFSGDIRVLGARR